MSWGALLLAGLGLTLLIEGLAYAIAPDAMKRLGRRCGICHLMTCGAAA